MRLLGMLLIVAASGRGAAEAPFAIHLRSTLPSPQAVGTPVGFMPRTENAGKGMLVYRYSVSVNGGAFHVVRDYSQQALFVWSPDLYEHSAAIRVEARNNETRAAAREDVPFRIVPRAAGASAAVTPTSHPLVALLSARPCPEGSQFRAAFAAEGEDAVTRTPAQPCRGSLTSNVYVAGMRAETAYRLRPEWIDAGGAVKTGDWLSFRTGMLDGHFSPVSIVVPRAAASPASGPLLLYSASSQSNGIRAMATDLQGRVVWFLRSPDFITRVLPGGRFLALGDGSNSVNSTREKQMLREFDLAGNLLRETNAGAVAEQLASRGIHSDCRIGGKECVSGLHHEAIRLPNGHTLVIAGLERIMPPGTQGSKKSVDVLGDLVVDLDEDFQVAGLWNSFDHFDLKRKSLSNATCKTGQGGCPPVLLAPEANGWTHSNSLNYIPSTGDLLISVPEQDWVMKIDWKNGKGSGKVLWRLGKDGDFKLDSDAKNPWFSFQHEAGYEPPGSNLLTLLDDAPGLYEKDKTAGSRAQTWRLDEEKMVATLVYNVDLGVHSACCGSMQALPGGGYLSVSGSVLPSYGRTVETDQDGKIVFAVDLDGVSIYRSYRLDNLYAAPVK